MLLTERSGPGVSRRAAAHARALVCIAQLAWAGCGGDSVDARAVWVDGVSGGQARRIHVYDRGDRYTLTVLGETDPRESILLGPRGHGLLVRAGERRGVWIDLDDGRRLPLRLHEVDVDGTPVSFTGRDDALWWLDEEQAFLTLVPLAAGLPLAREDDGSMRPLAEPGAVVWAVSSSDAPMLLTKDADGGARFLRYPDDVHDGLTLVREAEVDALALPQMPSETHSCGSLTECKVLVAIDPDGERTLGWTPVDDQPKGLWVEFDRRAPELAGELLLPEPLAIVSTLRLLQLLDRWVSVWVGPGFLYRWDRRTAQVESVPLFATSLHWFSVARGRAMLMVSSIGPMYRIDPEKIEILNLETTICIPSGAPVVAPNGRWAAWTCRDETNDPRAASGVIVRVSAAGIERHAGIAMATLAIDDAGDLLVYSVESTQTDVVDGVAPTDRPRSLFVLTSAGTITRIDEFEPAPAAIAAGEFATYVQAAALE
jgi:hypothetical protein